MRSSMLAAIERGRIPSIDFLNGEVAAHGRAAHVATPVNDRVVEIVWEIANGRAMSSRDTLDRVCASE
jgi:2-dehydropantoate 2-reductase